MEGGGYNTGTVEKVFRDFKGRRSGLIMALTEEAEVFYQRCDPDDHNLCLYGLPDGSWEVNLPLDMIPAELPEPTLGINFPRDGMQKKYWLALVALHSDAWLLAVAFYYGARLRFDKADRKQLFAMINDLPTLFEVVTSSAKKQQIEKSSVSNHSSSKSKSNSKSEYPKAQERDEDEGLKSLLQGLSISSSTNARLAATKGHVLDRFHIKGFRSK